MRKLIKNQFRTAYGKQGAFNRVMNSLSEPRQDIMNSYDLDSIFSEHNCPLFFNELMAMISKEWELFKNVFEDDKNRVIMALGDINKTRADAHAKALSEEDFSQVRLHFSRLEGILSDWI